MLGEFHCAICGKRFVNLETFCYHVIRQLSTTLDKEVTLPEHDIYTEWVKLSMEKMLFIRVNLDSINYNFDKENNDPHFIDARHDGELLPNQ